MHNVNIIGQFDTLKTTFVSTKYLYDVILFYLIYTNVIKFYFGTNAFKKSFGDVFQYWNVLALDGSNWQRVDLFDFQTDVEVNISELYL